MIRRVSPAEVTLNGTMLGRQNAGCTTKRAQIAFWDAQRARTVPEENVMEQLAGDGSPTRRKKETAD